MSHLEDSFAFQLRAHKIFTLFVREYKFHPDRRWRFDFACPELKLAVEIEGGIWGKGGGRHRHGSGFVKDIEKYNAAAERGWRVVRLHDKLIESGEGIQMVLRIVKKHV